MEIKILGSGCPTCRRLETLAREVADELDLDATFVKVTEMQDIMAYDIISTPALVVDDEVKSAGRIPRKDVIKTWLTVAQA